MRRLATLMMTLIGAGLALPVATRAGQPGDCPTCGGGVEFASVGYPGGAGPDTTRHSHPHTRRCPKCQLERAQRAAGNNNLVITGPASFPDTAGVPCATCGGAVSSVGEAPGYAMLGPGGSSVVSPEPAPIGVVQAGYRPGLNPGNPAAAAMMGMGAPGRSPYSPMVAGGGHAGYVPPPQTPMGGAHRRPSVLAHLFGLDGLGHLGDSRRERRAAAHAATRVGNLGTAPASALPASMVYGR